MTTEHRDEGGLPCCGNLWDGDADSEGLRFLASVASRFASYANEELRWIQADPLAGKDAATQLVLGTQLEFIGRAMLRHAELRARLMDELGGRILEYLAALAPNERVDPDSAANAIEGATSSVVLVLQDLARSEFVQVWRQPPKRIGERHHATLYAISAKGRLLLERTAVTVGRQAFAVADQAPSHESR